jgi:hypothetical protein
LPIGEGKDLVEHYEQVRAQALSAGVARAGLGAGLLVAKGMVAWMRGWRACQAAPAKRSSPAAARSEPAEVVDVLAAMALACAGGDVDGRARKGDPRAPAT